MTDCFVRPLALCVFRHRDRLLVVEGFDRCKDQRFYRCLGGQIEFGEHSREALVREIREELGAKITNLRLLGSLENLFTFEGRPGHEIVQVYAADFVDEAFYRQERFDFEEPELGLLSTAIWVPLGELANGQIPLYPDGFWELLEATGLVVGQD